MPFRDASFDAIMCCYLLELLGSDDILLTLREFRRVLKRPGGGLTLVTIGQYDPAFNQLYKVAGKIAPAFWGRQVERARGRTDRIHTVPGHGRSERAPGILSFASSDRPEVEPADRGDASPAVRIRKELPWNEETS